MTVLPITNPSPAPRETVHSYLSRLAATWRTDVTSLAYDMAAPFKKFTAQDPAAFEALAEWAGLDPRQLNEMLSWTGIRAGNVRMDFRGEVFGTRALRNPVMRGCPVCLREDAAGHAGPGTDCDDHARGLADAGGRHLRPAPSPPDPPLESRQTSGSA